MAGPNLTNLFQEFENYFFPFFSLVGASATKMRKKPGEYWHVDTITRLVLYQRFDIISQAIVSGDVCI
jgi:hypothetical protein